MGVRAGIAYVAIACSVTAVAAGDPPPAPDTEVLWWRDVAG